MNQAQKIDKAFILADRLGSLISVGVISFLFLVGWVVVGLLIRNSFDLMQWTFLAVWFVLTSFGVFCSFYFPKRTYETTLWQLKPHGIEIRRGIWWKHQIFIPRERVQHTDIKQGPIMRGFGIVTLVINTGGTFEPSIPLAGILPETAEAIREQLSLKGDSQNSLSQNSDSQNTVAMNEIAEQESAVPASGTEANMNPFVAPIKLVGSDPELIKVPPLKDLDVPQGDSNDQARVDS